MKIGILTSSRADFGIYLPLLNKLYSDAFFHPEIIAFGTHLSSMHGNTITEIFESGFEVKHQINTVTPADTPSEIANNIGETIKTFAVFWEQNQFDLVLVLGDRYEMFAAVVAASPFNLKFGHISAGETTLGAIDNSYRHSISLISQYLFVSTDEYKRRAIEICHDSDKVFNVGALSIDNLKYAKLFNIEEFNNKYNIDLERPTILTTFQPETVLVHKNEVYIANVLESLYELSERYQIVITMPNSDTAGLMIRTQIEKFAVSCKNIYLIESFGMKGYLSCMKYCSFLLGNTSSGFVEASYFPKYVINLGDRQKGRIITPNIFSIPVLKEKILETVEMIENAPDLKNLNIYGDGDASGKIMKVLKEIN